MSKKVTLLRPFVFSTPAVGEQRVPREQRFFPLKDAHSGVWIPTEVTAARVQAEQTARKKKDEDDALQLQKAQDALRRAGGAHEVHQVNEKDVERQLNTPVNQLGAQQGQDINKTADPAQLEVELNTPVNKLAAKK